MKRIAAVAGLLLCASLAFAQLTGQKLSLLAIEYDLDSTSYVYPVFTGRGEVNDSEPTAIEARITTSGSSVTTTAVDATTDPFALVAVGDEISVNLNGQNVRRVVVTKASADSITVNLAWDLSAGYAFGWRAATTASGWFPVRGFEEVNFVFDVTQLVVTDGIDWKVECRPLSAVGYTGGAAVVIGPLNVATVSTSGTYVIEPWDECRVGIKIGTADDGDDLTTNKEKINIAAILRRR